MIKAWVVAVYRFYITACNYKRSKLSGSEDSRKEKWKLSEDSANIPLTEKKHTVAAAKVTATYSSSSDAMAMYNSSGGRGRLGRHRRWDRRTEKKTNR